jgi:hypothetical protein
MGRSAHRNFAAMLMQIKAAGLCILSVREGRA